MPSHAEWIKWMPSPPLVPDEPPLDLEHLTRMTCGEQSLERDVLAMFAVQAGEAAGQLGTHPDDAEALAHTLGWRMRGRRMRTICAQAPTWPLCSKRARPRSIGYATPSTGF